MSQSQTTLVKHVLQELGALAAGATAEAVDTTAVTEQLTQLYASLTSRRIYVVADANAIADDAYPAILRLATEALAPTFGRQANKDIVAAAEAELAALARLSRTAYTGVARQVIELLAIWGASNPAVDLAAITDRADQILADLAQRGVAYVTTLADLSDFQVPHVARIIAAQLTPKPLYEVIRQAEVTLLAQTRGETKPQRFETSALFQRARRGSYNGR
jgi:hypothetical protein